MSMLHTITTDVLNPVVPAIEEHHEAAPVQAQSIIHTHFDLDEISGEFGE